VLVRFRRQGFQVRDRLRFKEKLPTVYINGNTPTEERQEVQAWLARGEMLAVVSTPALDVGVDLPGLRAVVLLSDGKSENKAIQPIGRGLRRNPEDRKEFWRDISRDAGADVAKWVAVGLPTAAALALLAGNVGVNLCGPGEASYAVSLDAERLKALGRRLKFWKKAPDVTPDAPTPTPPSGQDAPPKPKKSATNGRGSRKGSRRSNRARRSPDGSPVPTRPFVPP
jgi:superfamily II DNA/RNA helicase